MDAPSADSAAPLLAALGAAWGGDARVAAAFLFGSRATGRARADSDIDVAVLLDPAPRPDEAYAVRSTLLAALAGHLATERVDLVVLNDAPPALAFRVLREGRLSFRRDPVVLHRFTVATYRVQGDYAPVEEHFRAATKARASRHGARRG